MAPLVRLSAEAERDLEEIGDRIASDNPERAVSFVRELRKPASAWPTSPGASRWSAVTSGTAFAIARRAGI